MDKDKTIADLLENMTVRELVIWYRDNRDHWDWDNLIDDLLMEIDKEVTLKAPLVIDYLEKLYAFKKGDNTEEELHDTDLDWELDHIMHTIDYVEQERGKSDWR